MVEKYICEKCKMSFPTKEKCLEHERNCCTTVEHYCAKTGKREIIDLRKDDAWAKENQWHKVRLGVMGYGSVMDGYNIEFELSDKALYEFIQSFEKPNLVLETGSNSCY